MGTAQNAYLAPNPTEGPAREGTRGDEEQTTRIAAVYADLDVKAGACPDLDACRSVMNTISGYLGEYPAVIIESGGGLQPIWALEYCPPDKGVALLRRFGRLVKAVGDEQGYALDSVFDAARVLRIPGSVNHKYTPPRPVVASLGGGGPMDPATLAERLDEWGVPEEDGDARLGLGEVVAPEDGWRWALYSCGYAVTTIGGWLSERVDARHPWLLSCLVRLECMRRNGCLTRAEYTSTRDRLEHRFVGMLTNNEPTREPGRYEIAGVRHAAVDRATRKDVAELAAELGAHPHLISSVRLESESPVSDAQPSGEQAAEDDSAPSAPFLALEQDFWERAALKRVYDAAIDSGCAPWAVLAVVAARVLTMVGPDVVLPPIGRPRRHKANRGGSLNSLFGLVGSSGGGKGEATAVAIELIPDPCDLDPSILDGVRLRVCNVGTGEGMADKYVKREGGKRVGQYDAVLFDADEIDALSAKADAKSSTTWAVLRSGFSGARLGFTAMSNRDNGIDAHTYRMCVVVNIQPRKAGPLMNDADGGTPQRFLLFPATDPRVPLKMPEWDGKYLKPLITLADIPTGPLTVEVASAVRRFVWENNAKRKRGQGDALDGHAMFCRLKFAFVLAVLDGRANVTEDDWRLAGIASSVSDSIRALIESELTDAEHERAADVGSLRGVSQAAAQASSVTALAEARAWYEAKVFTAGADGITRRELHHASKRHRPFLDAVLTELVDNGRAEQMSRGRFCWKPSATGAGV